ncbi:MAG: AmmeMemoRadiSam system radical SAM enzyme [Thermoplasmata archaeon]
MSIFGSGGKEARFWKVDGDRVRCELCPHFCKIAEGKSGICNVRKNSKGKLYTLIYGKITSMTPDPIEKKPLFHFHPGTSVLSFGTVGCNYSCPFCQNYSISQAKPENAYLRDFKPESVVPAVKKSGCAGVAWTYNEPTIWHEFAYDCSKLVKEAGYYSVYVTNGYINEEPLREIAPYLDAMNVDLKSLKEDFYQKMCKAKVQPVLDAIVLGKELGIHVELTNLVIPGENDKKEDFEELTKWVVENLGQEVPMHFSRFHPDYKMLDKPRTPLKTLELAYRIAKDAGLKYVYVGNIPTNDRENTFCPNCGNMVIERWGFSISKNNLDGDKCKKCGGKVDIVA